MLVDAVLPVDAVEFVSVAPDAVSVALVDEVAEPVQTDEALAVLADAAVVEARIDAVSVAFVDAVAETAQFGVVSAAFVDAVAGQAQTDEVSIAFVDAVLLADVAAEPVQTGVVDHFVV